MVTFLPPRCCDCGALPGKEHQSWCPFGDPGVLHESSFQLEPEPEQQRSEINDDASTSRVTAICIVLIARRWTWKRCAHSSLKKHYEMQFGAIWENSDIAERSLVLSMDRQPGNDVLLPRSSGSGHAEALWKQEGTKCRQFLRNRAHGGRRAGTSNCRKCRRNTQTSAIVHGPFGTTHNLKVVGSNPTPATRLLHDIKRLSAALRGGVCVSNTRGSTVEARGAEILHTGS